MGKFTGDVSQLPFAVMSGTYGGEKGERFKSLSQFLKKGKESIAQTSGWHFAFWVGVSSAGKRGEGRPRMAQKNASR